jgi:hypothetical protein
MRSAGLASSLLIGMGMPLIVFMDATVAAWMADFGVAVVGVFLELVGDGVEEEAFDLSMRLRFVGVSILSPFSMNGPYVIPFPC